MTEINELKLKNYCAQIERELLRFTQVKPELQGIVVQAMEYSLTAGGKRLRPMLMLEFCRMCGGDISAVLDIACTIEMIHTFSLIHDDLPCMDNDDFRRGKPSCHKAFPENIALLAGDALNTLPFEVISGAAIDGRITAETAVMLISVLSKSVGINGMIGGQVIDLQSEGKDISEETLNVLQEHKTGALIEAACVMGVVLAGKYDKIPAAARYASALGRAFQIVDDILDVIGTFEEIGKPVGSDSEQNKSTYVSVLGLERSRCEADRLTGEALSYLNEFDDCGFLSELTESLLERRS
ncbi:polyprenyl synthetase family protein [Ruminococcus sp. Marseille-P6503]|uniref:polyprenyl synthetase family protein n=1 Tax=Ruminococcus sp. Marseille-P6503 TaxID=2364796 RepID=UPI000F51DCEE|nr:farnesyl diphosphate synthase [Ruminococcus sp. Marseille-P6503]